MAKEIIRLKVPSSEDPENPRPEFVSHGNFDFELVPGTTVETKNPNVAQWLVDAHGLEEIERVPSEDEPADVTESIESSEEETDFAAGYPDDFPGREALIAADVPHATAIALNAEQLVGYNGIGPKTADAIVAYVANGGNE